MTPPKPGRDGLFKAEDFSKGSNPHWEPWTPVRHSADGRIALVCGGVVYAASQLGQSGAKRGKR